jgi:hypothetical protein
VGRVAGFEPEIVKLAALPRYQIRKLMSLRGFSTWIRAILLAEDERALLSRMEPKFATLSYLKTVFKLLMEDS